MLPLSTVTGWPERWDSWDSYDWRPMQSDLDPALKQSSIVDRAERVVIVMAMEAEAAPLTDALGAQPLDPPVWATGLPCQLSHAPKAEGRPDVLLAVNGTDPIYGVDAVGSTAAALTTHVALNLDRPRPDLVLSVGTAGGWLRAGAEIGDAFLAWPHFACHDRRIPLPGFDVMGNSELPAADLRSHASVLGCRLGIVTSGDSFDESPTDRERILANGAEVKEMEAAAVAWVGHLHGVPTGALKTITDLVDSPVATEAQFVENLATAAETLRRKTLALLERLAQQDGV